MPVFQKEEAGWVAQIRKYLDPVWIKRRANSLITVLSAAARKHFDPVWIKKHASLVFLLLSVVTLGAVLGAYTICTGYYYVVCVDDLEIGLLNAEEDLSAIMDSLQAEAEAHYGLPVQTIENVGLEKIFRPAAEADEQTVRSKLRRLLSYKVEAKMMTVDGRDIHPVMTENEVETVIELVKGAYISPQENITLEEIQIGETISARDCCVYPEELFEAETLASILLRGTDRREVYLVSRGDSLWKIARENQLSMEKLQEANPQINGDAINIGDEINLIVAEPLVNVKTVERLVTEESIPFETEHTYDSSLWKTQSRVVKSGVLGKKEVVYQVVKENGVEVNREKIEEIVVKEPEPRVIAAGIANIPSRGTGSFIWPVKGGGRISSGYGWRSGGFHGGVDIAAPKGTSVLAADSGVVVFQGWDGGYGLSIVINHGQFYTRYAHNTKNLVKTGQAVNKGQAIATIGSTGRSTGSHLHFEVRSGGTHGPTINPLNYFSP